MFKNVFTTDLAVFTNWKTVKDVQRSLTVEPRTDSDLDAADDDVHGGTDIIAPKQRDLVGYRSR